jgi:transposase-like protein
MPRPSALPNGRLRRLRALTEETLENARRLYETTSTPIERIAGEAGIHRSTLLYHAIRLHWVRHGHAGAAHDGAGTVCPGIALCPVRTTTQRRLHDLLLARLRLAETKSEEATAADRERAVRSLSGLVRTLEKLTAMDREAVARPRARRRDPSEEIAPYDVEELRQELSRKLELLLRERGLR